MSMTTIVTARAFRRMSFTRWLAVTAALCCPISVRPSAEADGPIRYGGVPAELSVSQVSDRTLRIEVTPLGERGRPQKTPPSAFLVPFPAEKKLRIRELDKQREVRLGEYRVTLRPQPLAVTVRRKDGTPVQELAFGENSKTRSISFRAAAPVLGLGEGADQFDRRGTNYPLINGQRYRLPELGTRIFSPFVIGTEGWALFLAAPSGGVDLRGERGLFIPQPGAEAGAADVFVIDARQPADAMREFARLTGAPLLPPKWALGYMQSHRTLSTEADILAEARTFREKKLPCDTFIFLGTGFCPAGWNFGHDSFQFNTSVFTREPAAVIHDLHSDHLHVVLHVVPPQAKYPALHGQIPPAPGEEADQQDIGTYWARHRDLFAAGVDGWWPDEGDWYDVPSRLARHRMYYEGPVSDRPNVRPWNLQRNGCPGIARYGGWVWSGDISSSWKTFAAQVKVGQNSSLSVSPFWGTDIGGFYPSADHEFTGELYARWFQFAAFCPSFRSHGRNWWLHRPWGWNTGQTGPIESRPVPDPAEMHDAEVEPVCRRYLNLRYQLMPYTYTIAREAHDTGLPLMRALWLHYSDDPAAVERGDEFLWGRDLLIAPVVEKAAKSRRVYLPAGTWFDWWTGETTPGKQWIERPVDLATMPIYVRSGAIIPLDPVRQFVDEPASEPTTLNIYPGADGEFTLYDDDGSSLEYRNGSDAKTVWIHFRWNDSARKLTIEPDARMKKRRGAPRVFSIKLTGRALTARQVEFRGRRVEIRL
jgi:alpha-glucosidase/alpha-D-xyloside xylohydrolase